MNSSDAGGLVARPLLPAVGATNTATATTSTSGGYQARKDLEGYVTVTQDVSGLASTSVAGKIQEADDANGTNATDVSGAVFTLVNAGNLAAQRVQVLKLDNRQFTKPFVGYVGTIVGAGTNPMSVVMHGTPKSV